jgi:O-antigen/teichoic acid export membrane protein
MTDGNGRPEPGPAASRRHLSGSILSVGASRGASLVAIALTSVVVTRLLGAAGIGAYSIGAALLLVFTVVFELGMPQALAYYAGRGEWSGKPLARGTVGACFLLAIPGALAMITGFALFGGLVPAISWPMAAALTAALPFSLLWRIGPQAALAQERFEAFALLDSSLALLACPVSIAGAALGGTEGAVIGFAASVVLSGTAIAAWLAAQSRQASQAASPPGGARAVLAYGTRAWMSELLTQVNLRADLVLVGAYVGATEAGVYSVALSTTSIAWVLTAAFAISALPRSARLHAEHGRAALGAAERDSSDARTIRHTVLVIPAVAIAELALLAIGIPLFYGDVFHRSVGLGLILLPGSLMLGVGMAAVAVLLGRGETSRVLWVGLAVVPATIAAYAIAIPASGDATGAAIVSTVSYAAYAALALLALHRVSGLRGRELLLPRRADLDDYRSLTRRSIERISRRASAAPGR